MTPLSKSSLVWVNAGLLMTTTQLVSSTAAQAYIATWLHILSHPHLLMPDRTFVRVDGRVRNAYLLDSDAFVRGHDLLRPEDSCERFDSIFRHRSSALAGDGPDSLILSILQGGRQLGMEWDPLRRLLKRSSSWNPADSSHLECNACRLCYVFLFGVTFLVSTLNIMMRDRLSSRTYILTALLTTFPFDSVFHLRVLDVDLSVHTKHNSLGGKHSLQIPFAAGPSRKLQQATSRSYPMAPIKTRSSVNSERLSYCPRVLDCGSSAHLIIRATCIIFAMATSIALFSLGIVKTKEFIFSPYWREVMAWLSTLSCTWSAIPIAWQCWRLYQDELGGTLPNGTCTSATPKIIKEDGVEPKPKPSESESDILIITIHPSCVKASE
ncbi:hypothetical protein PSTT_07248 [Puccinia striiformis]|uniref:Uncharacterized protein n=1 Tax=Puccinia striiformis TaxID=27350 RepID=A0A2S4VH18_9BASI|nr:hypothetical protein PSTT_07248 [Puccinia striiformis]